MKYDTLDGALNALGLLLATHLFSSDDIAVIKNWLTANFITDESGDPPHDCILFRKRNKKYEVVLKIPKYAYMTLYHDTVIDCYILEQHKGPKFDEIELC